MFSQIKARYNKFFEQTIEERDGKNMKDIIDKEETNQELSMIQDKKDHKNEDVNLKRRNRNKYRYGKTKETENKDNVCQHKRNQKQKWHVSKAP